MKQLSSSSLAAKILLLPLAKGLLHLRSTSLALRSRWRSLSLLLFSSSPRTFGELEAYAEIEREISGYRPDQLEQEFLLLEREVARRQDKELSLVLSLWQGKEPYYSKKLHNSALYKSAAQKLFYDKKTFHKAKKGGYSLSLPYSGVKY